MPPLTFATRRLQTQSRTHATPAEPATMPPAREVTVLAAGGTIAMAGTGGAVPQLDAHALVAAIPELTGLPGLSARTLGTWPGVHVTQADALEIARVAVAEAATGRGVVVTHGTDTLEETAVLIDLLHGGDAPIVVTGAIRPASAAGADGPANLLDAVRAAGAAETAGLGVLVAFAGELHAARRVRKSDSVSPRAFSSPGAGPAGRVAEESVAAWSAPPRRPPLPVAHLDARVELAHAGLGADGALVRELVAAGVDGIVAVLLGAGHAPPAFLAACRSAGERIPVAATVRPEAGRILRGTYGFEGAERDVRAAGLILAPACSPAAARMTLLACLGAGHSRVAMAGVFAADDP
jgi:L-asparaginase